MSEEWGLWIEHDGKGCPCVGMFVECVTDTGNRIRYIAGSMGKQCRSWDRRYSICFEQVVRYRVRKPRALSQLQEMIRNLPEKVDA